MNSKNITLAAMMAVMTVITFSTQMFIPPIGLVLAFFCSIPMMYCYENTDRQHFYISIITSSILILFMNDLFGWILFSLIFVPVTIAVMEKNFIMKALMVIPVEIGSYILFGFVTVGTSLDPLSKTISTIWYIVGIGFYFGLYLFYDRVFAITKAMLKKLNM